MTQKFSKVLNKIEPFVCLPGPLLDAFHKAQNAVPLPNVQAEKILLFLPLLNFPLLGIEAPLIALLFYFFQLLLSAKKPHIYFFIEPAFLLSFGFHYPNLAPFAFLFLLSGWIFMHLNFTIFYHHPVNRFFWITAILFFPTSIILLAPLLLCICLTIGIHKRFFVWRENKSE